MLGFQCSSTRVQNGSNLISWFLHNTSPGSTKTWVWESLYSMKKEWEMFQVQRTFHTFFLWLSPKAWILAICLLIPGALEKRYEAVGKTTGKHFFFWGSQGFPWVREFCNCGSEIGLKLEFWFWSKLPCLANEQGNVPEKVTVWIWHQLRLIRCPAVGVVAEAWVVTSPVVDFGKMSPCTQPKRRKVLSSKAFHWCPVQSLVTFWRICRPNCMIWAGRCGNLI